MSRYIDYSPYSGSNEMRTREEPPLKNTAEICLRIRVRSRMGVGPTIRGHPLVGGGGWSWVLGAWPGPGHGRYGRGKGGGNSCIGIPSDGTHIFFSYSVYKTKRRREEVGQLQYVEDESFHFLMYVCGACARPARHLTYNQHAVHQAMIGYPQSIPRWGSQLFTFYFFFVDSSLTSSLLESISPPLP